MKKLLIKNIKLLVQVEDSPKHVVRGLSMNILPCIENAYLAIENDTIVDYGSMSDWQGISDWSNLEIIDAEGKIVLPTFCDSHTHAVYAGSREQEYVDRLHGLTYQEIALRGGGILNSAARMGTATEEELYTDAYARIQKLIRLGTGAIEIKSGYGLSLETELKMLRVIQRLKLNLPIAVKATFLGAHAIPPQYKDDREGYIDLICNEMLPQIHTEQLADYCDVFCEENYFTPTETIRILSVAKNYGLQPKAHANQLAYSGGVQAGVKVDAVSVDHLEYVGDTEIEALKKSNTVPTILPGAQYFLGLPNPPVRAMLEADLPIAIASDYNPGSCPNGNMWWMLQHACVAYKITPNEAFNASTINSAYAMGISQTHGSICPGKKANFIITAPVPSLNYLLYNFGMNNVEAVYIKGEKQI
ncbi:MAG: imidazolonepropionase [Bacteroidia bacterium]|nr:imidazolonepropionase [Bacteroidia bacterium]